MNSHQSLIDALGGAVTVARDLGNVNPRMVRHWYTRGIAWSWRNEISKLAKRRGVKLPDGFLAAPRREAA